MKSFRERREYLQGESSDEGGLDPERYCTKCGSRMCWQDRDTCWGRDKIDELNRALDWFKNESESAMDGGIRIFDKDQIFSLKSTLAEQSKRVDSRDAQKVEIRERMRIRRGNQGMNVAEKILMMESLDSEIGKDVSQKAQPYAGAPERTISQIITSEGPERKGLMAIIDEAVRNGREYMQGGCCEALCRSVAFTYLRRATAAYRSQSQAIKIGAPQHVRSFLALCPRSQMNKVADWALPVAQKIWNGFANPWDPRGGSTSLGAGPEPALPRVENQRTIVDEAKKVWDTREFAVTLTHLRGGGAKVSIWECIRMEKGFQRSRKKRLQRIHLSEDSAAAKCRAVLQSYDVGSLRADETDAANIAEGLPIGLEDKQALTGEALKAAVAAEKGREADLKKQDQESLRVLAEPGSWRCSRCRRVNFPKVHACPGYVVRHKGRDGPRSGWQLCKGSQAETWGGYVRNPERPVPEEPKRRTSALARRRLKAKMGQHGTAAPQLSMPGPASGPAASASTGPAPRKPIIYGPSIGPEKYEEALRGRASGVAA